MRWTTTVSSNTPQATGNDYVGHKRMYRTFVTLTRSAVPVIAGIVILMAIFLV